jgi:hypothetical protein
MTICGVFLFVHLLVPELSRACASNHNYNERSLLSTQQFREAINDNSLWLPSHLARGMTIYEHGPEFTNGTVLFFEYFSCKRGLLNKLHICGHARL